MNAVDLVVMLAVIQYLVFGSLAGQARGKYGVQAPAVSGNEGFERVYRVQMNTLELLVALVPSMYAAVRYLPAWVVAGSRCVYLVGCLVYWRAYISNPKSRGLGFLMSITPVFGLAVAAAIVAHSARVRPNPSLKRSANGRPPGPGPRYGVHFLSPGPGVLQIGRAHV